MVSKYLSVNKKVRKFNKVEAQNRNVLIISVCTFSLVEYNGITKYLIEGVSHVQISIVTTQKL